MSVYKAASQNLIHYPILHPPYIGETSSSSAPVLTQLDPIYLKIWDHFHSTPIHGSAATWKRFFDRQDTLEARLLHRSISLPSIPEDTEVKQEPTPDRINCLTNHKSTSLPSIPEDLEVKQEPTPERINCLTNRKSTSLPSIPEDVEVKQEPSSDHIKSLINKTTKIVRRKISLIKQLKDPAVQTVRMYHCPFRECNSSYSTVKNLKGHLQMKHPDALNSREKTE